MAFECQKSHFEIERVFVCETYQGDYPQTDAPVVTVSESVFRFLSDEKTPQGVLCRVRIPKTELCPPTESCIFLDGVADPGNVGAIIRTANAAGYHEIYLGEGCADPYSPKCVRASMSGVFFTKLYFGARSDILRVLEGTPVIAADMDGENAFTFTAPKRFALAIGNEANGLSEETFAKATHTVKIPMESTQESLNAAVSAGILAYLLKKDVFTK